MADNKSENSSGSEAFECSICLEQATEPVVTLCGHLFWFVHALWSAPFTVFFSHPDLCHHHHNNSWPCLAKWMDSPMSAHNTCPVCKSLITRESIVPLYGRGAPPHKHSHPAAAAAAAAAAAPGGNQTATDSQPPVSGSYSLNDTELRQRQQEQPQAAAGSSSSTEDEHIPPRPQGHRQPPPTNQYGQYVPQAVPGAYGMNNGGGFFGNILPGYGSVNFGFGFGLPFLGFGSMWAPFRQPPVVQPGLSPNARPQGRAQNPQNQTISGIVVGVLLFIFLLLMLFSSSQTQRGYMV